VGAGARERRDRICFEQRNQAKEDQMIGDVDSPGMPAKQNCTQSALTGTQKSPETRMIAGFPGMCCLFPLFNS
jgi:hypothetical protein